eukprot:14886787-Ditylum_brightwellii.AAC.1
MYLERVQQEQDEDKEESDDEEDNEEEKEDEVESKFGILSYKNGLTMYGIQALRLYGHWECTFHSTK